MVDSLNSATATPGLTMRALFLVGFIFAMPLLALPSIARQADRWIYGKVQSSIPPLPPASQPKFEVAPPAPRLSSTDRPKAAAPGAIRSQAREVSPVSFPAPLLVDRKTAGSTPAEADLLSSTTLQRLEKIRVELERLGADEIRLEQFEQPTPSFAFFCRMLVGQSSVETKPFAAVESQPLLAAEKVLREVRSWRLKLTLAEPAEPANSPLPSSAQAQRRNRYAPPQAP